MSDETLLRCPLCGARFTPQEACHTGCPMSRHCATVCCPRCGMSFVAVQRSVAARLLDRLLPGRRP